MCPFIGQPEGFTPEALELLDRALQCLWDDMATAARARGPDPRASPLAPAPAREAAASTAVPLRRLCYGKRK